MNPSPDQSMRFYPLFEEDLKEHISEIDDHLRKSYDKSVSLNKTRVILFRPGDTGWKQHRFETQNTIRWIESLSVRCERIRWTNHCEEYLRPIQFEALLQVDRSFFIDLIEQWRFSSAIDPGKNFHHLFQFTGEGRQIFDQPNKVRSMAISICRWDFSGLSSLFLPHSMSTRADSSVMRP